MLKKVDTLYLVLIIGLISISRLNAQTCTCNNYGPQLINNGDFSQGNTGFTSDYNFATIAIPGRYGISTAPWQANFNWSHCTDHTTGAGNMLWADCSDTASLNLWSESVPVNPNTNYIFTCWVLSLDQNTNSTIQFSINAQAIDTPFITPVVTCSWVQFCYIWNSGNSTSATIAVKNISQNAVGNDVGLDDISFEACCSSITKNVAASICSGTLYQLPDGSIVGSSGTYYDTLKSYIGCDSVIITSLSVKPVSAYTQNISICSGQSYFAGGAPQTSAGTYYDTLVNSFGCDSVRTTVLNVLPVSANSINVSICQGQKYLAGGALQSASGVYTDTLTNSVGCDSFLTTQLTVLVNSAFSINASICNGEFYYAGGAQQSASGIYYDTLVNYLGCDSVITTNLTVLPVSSITVSASICQGQSYYAGGSLQTSSGVYTDTFNNYLGCDSIITTNLTVLANSFFSRNISICNGQSFYAGGSYQTQSGIYIDTILNAAGCDSTVTTNLTVIPNTAFSQNISICFGDSFYAGGLWQMANGIFIDHFTNNLGCDSTLTTNLTVFPLIYTVINPIICNDETYYAGGTNQNQTGTYLDTLFAVSGCDSIVTTNLTVLLPISNMVFASVCQGQSYLAGGSFQTMPGLYSDTLISAMGCDSVLLTDLTINPVPLVNLGNDTAFCDGSSVTLNAGAGFQYYEWQDGSVDPLLVANDTGLYWVRVTNSFGCMNSDSMSVTALYSLPKHFLPSDTFICGNIALTVSAPGFAGYLWDNGDTTATYVFYKEGTASLFVTDAYGCAGSDTISVKNVCDDDLLFPNAFTPNGDGMNDVFLPIIIKNISAYRMVIFNRWAREVYASTDPLTGWNGSDNGLPGEIGVFLWSVDYTLEDGNHKTITGNVTLLR